MNNFLTRNLRQAATAWGSSAKDAYGNTTFLAPVSIKVRWEDKIERTTDSTGKDIVSQAFVFMGRKYDTGAYLYLGTSTDTTPPAGSYEIRNFQSIPSVRGDKFEYRAIL